MANSADPDQMQHSAVSDLGLYCLHMPVYPNTLNKTVHYKTESDIRQFKERPQNCCLQTKMYRIK